MRPVHESQQDFFKFLLELVELVLKRRQLDGLVHSVATGMTGIAVMRATGPLCRYAKQRLICFGGERRRHHRDSSQLHGITSGIVF